MIDNAAGEHPLPLRVVLTYDDADFGRSKPQALLIRALANLKQFQGDKEAIV